MMEQSLIDRVRFFIQRQKLNRNFSSKEYWNLRYENNWNSGAGSYGESAKAKAKVFNQILKDFKINSVIELGCGDGHQLELYDIPHYLGLDLSAKVVKQVIEQYKPDPTKSFFLYDPTLFQLKGPFLQADASISVDVLFHLVEDSVFEKYMQDLFQMGRKHVLIYATNFDDEKAPVAHLRNRQFTKWVQENLPHWELLEERPAFSDSGAKFLNWFIYQKKTQ